jgi:hypothetical protein
MAHSKRKLKSSGEKVSPCFRSFWTGKLIDKCLPIWALLYVSFTHLNQPNYFHGYLKFYENTAQYFLLTES